MSSLVGWKETEQLRGWGNFLRSSCQKKKKSITRVKILSQICRASWAGHLSSRQHKKRQYL